MNNFSSFLSLYRKNNKLSREEVVDIIKSKSNRIYGVDASCISMWEKNVSSPSIKMMCKIIYTLDSDISVMDTLKTFYFPKDARLKSTIERVVTRKLGCISCRQKTLYLYWHNDQGEGRYVDQIKDISAFSTTIYNEKIEINRLSLNGIDSGFIIYSKLKNDIYIYYINYTNIESLKYCLIKLCEIIEYSNCEYILSYNVDQTMMDIMMLIRGSMTQRKIVMDKFFVISRITLILNEFESNSSTTTLCQVPQ